MKTKERTQKSAVQSLRDTRDKIGKDIQNMTLEELNQYLEKEPLHPAFIKRTAG